VKKGSLGFPFTGTSGCLLKFGAGKESRTLDLNLGKVALYQLSYARIELSIISQNFPGSAAG
jgi:hypothetical protein